MRVALKVFNRLYTKQNVLKDSFTWIYVFQREVNPMYYDHYLASNKNPKSVSECVFLIKHELNEFESFRFQSMMIYTKNVGAYITDFQTNNKDLIQKQYIIRDYYIKLE